MEPKLTINMRRIAEGSAVLEIHGELTRLAEKPLDAAYAEAIGLAAPTIVLDLSGLIYMNNKGVGLLVRTCHDAAPATSGTTRKSGRCCTAWPPHCASSDDCSRPKHEEP